MQLQEKEIFFSTGVLQWIDRLADNGIFTTDTGLVIRSWNYWLEINTGRPAREMVGKNLFEVFPELALQNINPYYLQALNGQVAVLSQRFHKYLIPIELSSGKSGFTHMQQTTRIAPLVSGNQVTGTITLIQDVTDRLDKEYELKKERDTLQDYLNIAGVMLLVLNPEQEVTLINRKGCEILGFREHEIIGRNWFDSFIPESERGALKNVFAKIMKGEIEPHEYHENVVLAKGGAEKIIAWHNSVLKDKNGRTFATLSSGEDITEKKLAEEKLKESEEKFRDLFENAHDLIQSVNEQGRFLYVNKRWKIVMGYTDDEIEKLTLKDILKEESYQDCMEKFAETKAGRTLENVEAVFITKHGDEIFVEGNISPHFKNGRFISTRAIFRDINIRKKLEETLRTLSIMDALTGLYNRRGFITIAKQQLQLAVRMNKDAGLFFLDLDGMKWINDNLGHKEGDNALIDTAEILKQTFRLSDIIGRIGGDEFVVLAINLDEKNAEALNKRLEYNISEFNRTGQRPYTLSVSIGFTDIGTGHSFTLEEMLERADALMYAQKVSKKKQR